MKKDKERLTMTQPANVKVFTAEEIMFAMRKVYREIHGMPAYTTIHDRPQMISLESHPIIAFL